MIKIQAHWNTENLKTGSKNIYIKKNETSISKRLNKDDNFKNRLRFNLPNSSAIQAK